MKKSIPVSQDLAAYFSGPCPVLSDNNAKMIAEEIQTGFSRVVEYGMGASTLYFLEALRGKAAQLISVENNNDWFEICVQQVRNQTGMVEMNFIRKPWTLHDVTEFIKAESDVHVPQNLKRLGRWQENLATGPFFRFSPEAKSSFSGKLGPLWPVFKPVFQLLTIIYYLVFPYRRPVNGEWRGKEGETELVLRNVGPSIKDQFGEAPNFSDYIDAGLREIEADLAAGKPVRAFLIIDGGPRHKIVEKILQLEETYKIFSPTICLCDASRVFYHDTLSKRPSGRFFSGSNLTLKGKAVSQDVAGKDADFWSGGPKTAAELAEKEVWLYRGGGQVLDEKRTA